MLLVFSDRFSGELRCPKVSHRVPAASSCVGCVGVLGAVPFAAFIVLHTSAELGLLH